MADRKKFYNIWNLSSDEVLALLDSVETVDSDVEEKMTCINGQLNE